MQVPPFDGKGSPKYLEVGDEVLGAMQTDIDASVQRRDAPRERVVRQESIDVRLEIVIAPRGAAQRRRKACARWSTKTTSWPTFAGPCTALSVWSKAGSPRSPALQATPSQTRPLTACVSCDALSQPADRDDLHNWASHVDPAEVGPLACAKVNPKAGLPVRSRQSTDGIVSDTVIAADRPETTLKAVELRRPVDADLISLAGTEKINNGTSSHRHRERKCTEGQSKSLHTL